MPHPFRSNNTTKSMLMLCVVLFLLHAGRVVGQNEVKLVDAAHYSNVFGETRNYRIFLPPGYDRNTEKRYPVIYFYHGWSQRYFGSSNPYGDFDKGNDNGGDNIANFVKDHDVIVVKPDGYNRSPDEQYYVRPYNVTPVETYRQFPIYFPELVDHIDATYRTLADRGHRGISGLSMGGFMTFWIGGKYPHLLSAAGNFCGSPEFTVGPKDFPVEYRHLDFYNNYGGMRVRLHYGNKDFIRGYHADLNRVWTQVMDNYSYQVFDAGHSTCGMREMFAFILESFEKAPAKPARWHHIDVYPQFSVWDYKVTTDRTTPGFTILENVDARGFTCAVREFLPDGQLIPSVRVSVTTAPLYEKDQVYILNDFDTRTFEHTQKTVRSDRDGRLTIQLDGSSHHIGINKKTDKPNLSIADVKLQTPRWAIVGEDILVELTILNKGLSTGKNIHATLTPTRPTATVIKGEASLSQIEVNSTGKISVEFRVAADTIAVERFKLTLRDDKRNEWSEFFEVHLKRKASSITDFAIADGRIFTVAKAGVDTETTLLGAGNGDGIANPGEAIVILVKDQDRWWRTDITSADPHINRFGINVRKSDNWTPFDHVGASAKYDEPIISSACPQGHTINAHVTYWLPEYPMHIVREGIVSFTIEGRDTTPPAVGRIVVTADNTVQVRLYDGDKITKARVTFIAQDDPKKTATSILADDGKNGDRVAGDQTFSQRMPSQVFGIFRVLIEAEDTFGNRIAFESPEKFVLH